MEERLEIEWFRKIIDIKTEIIEELKSTKILFYLLS